MYGPHVCRLEGVKLESPARSALGVSSPESSAVLVLKQFFSRVVREGSENHVTA